MDVSKSPPLTVTVPSTAPAPWAQIAAQLPRLGRSGMTYRLVDPGRQYGGGKIHMLTYRGADGELLGVLYYYPTDFVDHGRIIQRGGTVNMWVHPAHQRRGIGAALGLEADRRWHVDLSAQRLTPGGLGVARRVQAARDAS